MSALCSLAPCSPTCPLPTHLPSPDARSKTIQNSPVENPKNLSNPCPAQSLKKTSSLNLYRPLPKDRGKRSIPQPLSPTSISQTTSN